MQTEVTSIGNNRYVLHRLVGSGGLGHVFLAHDTALNRWVAVKRLKADSESEAQRAEAVLKEARNLAALQHPNIVTVYDCFREEADTFVVMEYVAGRTIEEITTEAPLTLEDFLTVARQSLEGLAAAHARGLLHRDIKASNIMVLRQPSGALEVKILDFGLAKFSEFPTEQSTDHNGSLLGSIHTMAPEQFERRPVDTRTDLYALGCVFYQCLAGRGPFDGDSVAEIMAAHLQNRYIPLAGQRPDIPPPLCRWVERLFSREPAKRPASARQAAGLLRAISEGSTAKVVLPEAPPPQKNWFFVASGIALATLLVGGGLFWALRGTKAPQTETSEPSAPPPALEKIASSLPPEPPAAPEFVIPASDTPALLEQLGKQVTVQGTVSRIGENRSGDVLYVNFLGNSRGDLSLVLFTTQDRKATDRARLNPLVGHQIQVQGVVTEYRGGPQIEITETTSIKVLDSQ